MASYESELPAPRFELPNVRAWRTALAVTVACVLAVVPFFTVFLPPVLDFPNHLARIWLIGGGAAVPPLSHIYEVRWWQASTNVAVDFVGALFARVLPLAALIKVLLLPMFLGPPLGAILLNRALFRGFAAWQLAAFAFIWGATAVEGFISFQIGLASALFAALAMRPLLESGAWKRLTILLALSAALLLIHPFAVLFLLLLVTAFEIGARVPWPMERHWLLQRLGRIVPAAAVCFAPLVALYVLSPYPPGAYGPEAKLATWYPISQMLQPRHLAEIYLSPVAAYRLSIDVPLNLPLAAVTLWAFAARKIRVHAGFLIVAASLMVLALAVPKDLGDGGSLPVRLVVAGALMVFAGMRPEFDTACSKAVFATLLVAAAVARVGWTTSVWIRRARDVDELWNATRPLPAGASVLVLEDRVVDGSKVPVGRLMSGCPEGVCPVARHLGSMVVIWNHVFIPTLFTVPGQHALGVKPPWTQKSVYSSHVPFLDEVGKPSASDPYLDHWRRDFDYVLVLDADLGQRFGQKWVRLVKDSGFARLYRIEHALQSRR